MSEDESNENEAPAAGDAGGEDEKAGFDAKKLILFVVLPLLLLGGGGGAAYFTGMLDPYLGGAAEEAGEHGDEEYADGDHGDGHGDDHSGGSDDSHGSSSDSHGDDGHGDDGHGDDGHGGGSSAFVPIPTMIVNLTGEDGESRFLRLTVQLELENPSESGAVEEVMPRVVDQFQTYLRELRVKDLRGSAGIYRLQMELLWRVNQAAAPVKVKDVLFQEILIQ